ncbi:hypothetical protein [Neolewinella persica]|uniref:hypothetical protein n=1 Tax=Neolewinella persica TaxID=70998 RepID=UPI0003805469|nr:hypothetical protein [Neolewinella persica]
MTLNTGQKLLLLALIIGAALRIPGWFTEEENARWRLFEVDEEQHVAIAMHRFNELNQGRDTIWHLFREASYNVRGYAYVNATIAHVWYRIFKQAPNFGDTVLLGRQMSTLYALLLIVVVFYLGRASGLSPPFAGTAALLMAACDVNATYSHYCLPASGYILFAWLALLGGIRLIRGPSWRSLGLLALGAAGAAVFKFDVFPLVWGGLLLILLSLRGIGDGDLHRVGIPWYFLPAGIGLLASLLVILTIGWSWEEIVYSFETLRKVNRDVIRSEDHFRDNLLTYPMGVLAGIGLPAFCLAAWSALGIIRRRVTDFGKFWSFHNLAVAYILGYLLTEFLVRWYMDTTFIRRVNVFMPAVALLAAFGLQRLRAKPWLIAVVIAWSLGLGIVGQSHHWFDTRIAMRDWANKELPKPAKVGISASINIDGLENWRYYLNYDWEYFIIHEAFYSRYTKSMTTPFGIPECCNGIYHCGPVDQCIDFQTMLLGQRDDLVLIKAFRTWDVFPERLLYHHFFGYYETFLGDVEVYRRVKPKKAERSTS